MRLAILFDLIRATSNLTTEPSAIAASVVPRRCNFNLAAIGWVIKVLVAPVSNIMGNFCLSLKVTSTTGMPFFLVLMGAEKNCGVVSTSQGFGFTACLLAAEFCR